MLEQNLLWSRKLKYGVELCGHKMGVKFAKLSVIIQ